jgi:aspartate aminotransferase-like enzyme
VTNDLESIGKVVKEFDKLFIVDAISSLSSLPFYTDEWNCDIVVAGSQKGWMVAPGLSFISVSPKGWDAFKESKMPKFYWDIGKAKSYMDRGQTPWTPALAILYGLEVSLNMIINEGLENVYTRHSTVANKIREGVKSLGLKLFADEKCASNTVTSVDIPDGIDAKTLLQTLQSDHQLVLAGGQGSLDGKIMRIGHMGYIGDNEITHTIESLKSGLEKVGFHPNHSETRG